MSYTFRIRSYKKEEKQPLGNLKGFNNNKTKKAELKLESRNLFSESKNEKNKIENLSGKRGKKNN